MEVWNWMAGATAVAGAIFLVIAAILIIRGVLQRKP